MLSESGVEPSPADYVDALVSGLAASETELAY